MRKYYFEINFKGSIYNGVIAAINPDHARNILNNMAYGGTYVFRDLNSPILIGQ